MSINIIGAGLSGCEAAWKVASMGINARLFEMKPKKKSAAHKCNNFAELVCSNSLKAERLESAAGLLKEEMRHLDSLLLFCADKCRVPAGGAIAVDRDKFSELVTEKIKSNPLIEVIETEKLEVPEDGITIVATGPLTSKSLAQDIEKICNGLLSFYDAAAPIITSESIDMDTAFTASRYNRGEDSDYINCPLNKEEYEKFYEALVLAQRAPMHDFDVRDPKVYEGCMPVEIMAQRGKDTLRFGPMKPVGLIDPKTGHRPWANLQLRCENVEKTLYNMVGFQTNLKFSEQKRVFGLIPALKNAEFVRFGVMHRNTFLNSPTVLNSDLSLKTNEKLFFAGQITGVEGYMESAASGIIAGINAVKKLANQKPLILPNETMIGALINYVTTSISKNFQPMGANFGILPQIEPHIRDKKLRYEAFAKRSIKILDERSGQV
ncbi:MAG: Methylenetetrahydrofolate--tRNA-(uracil-5-)-methyltransferase TrmFO [Eubacteriales bacterium SKADARSKE-1]|nr:Methylenetetrahydrofolate--tRNA-(uracil-5-)-methyltransferase TrmFO [Eubacteriales bacterium SKADARSKE-1]